jgi:hypothetical protein
MLESLCLLLAHGADPRPIRWDEATANLVKFFVTILLALLLSYPVLAPLFPRRSETQESTLEKAEPNSGLVGWLALGLLLILSMAWWLTRTSIVELTTSEVPAPEHAHTQERGGQVAMWGDFHAEVARIESGEVRVYLTDSYNRPIAARFFQAEVTPIPADSTGVTDPVARATATPNVAEPRAAGPAVAGARQAKVTVPALDDSYRFARLDRSDKAYRVKITTPGWSVTLKFEFDETSRRRSLPIWCGTPES